MIVNHTIISADPDTSQQPTPSPPTSPETTASPSGEPQPMECRLGNETTAIRGLFTLSKMSKNSKFVFMDMKQFKDITYDKAQQGVLFHFTAHF